MSRFRSLTSRLVVTTVALVALASVLIGTATALVMRSNLSDRLDRDVRATVERTYGGPGPGRPHDKQPMVDGLNQAPGTLIAIVGGPNAGAGLVGEERGEVDPLSQEAVDELERVPVDRGLHLVELPDAGSYRVGTVDLGEGLTLVVGLPTDDVDDTVMSLVWVEVLVGLLAVVAAGGVGAIVVGRQLRPLREVADTAHRVAELPLSEGEIDLSDRVPAHLTDERTEVGQVGAALNLLLEHVEASLDARHRSELQVRQFVADASHELRTPLTTIAGYTELARRHPDDPDNGMVRTALGKVEEESARMTSLVEDMLLLARLDDGRPLDRDPVDLTRLLVEAVDDARVIGPDHRWRLELQEIPQPVEVTGDEQRLHQVITNLLTNARKHTPAGTTVTVTVRADGFDVHDDGPGFPADFVDHAFERFARVDQSRERRTDQGGGAGLGLSLVEAIVRSHDGTVTLDSAPGGTTIVVRLR